MLNHGRVTIHQIVMCVWTVYLTEQMDNNKIRFYLLLFYCLPIELMTAYLVQS